MSDFFDRLGAFFKTIFSDQENTGTQGKPRYYDNDMQDAWDELEDYLAEGKGETRTKTKREERVHSAEELRNQKAREALRDDYANLKVPFAASFDEVRQAYKKLLRQYHPDKHAGDQQKYKMATEITSRINQSFQRIREFEEKRKK